MFLKRPPQNLSSIGTVRSFDETDGDGDDGDDLLAPLQPSASAPAAAPQLEIVEQPRETVTAFQAKAAAPSPFLTDIDDDGDDSPAPRNLGALANATGAALPPSGIPAQVGAGMAAQAQAASSPATVMAIEDEAGQRGHADEAKRALADTHIDDLLRAASKAGGSDLHLTVALPPMVRRDGKVCPLPYEVATGREIQRLVYDILSSEQIEKFERTKELDFSYGVSGLGRYRFNIYKQRGSVGAAMRVIPSAIPSLESLKLPPVLAELTRRHSGLILVTGPTGSGKSTTIASMIDIINIERRCIS